MVRSSVAASATHGAAMRQRGVTRGEAAASGSWIKLVPRAPDDFEVGGSAGVTLDLLPQPSNMHGDGGGAAGEIAIPDGVEELIAAEDFALMGDEKMEEVELFGGHRHGLGSHAELAIARIQL